MKDRIVNCTWIIIAMFMFAMSAFAVDCPDSSHWHWKKDNGNSVIDPTIKDSDWLSYCSAANWTVGTTGLNPENRWPGANDIIYYGDHYSDIQAFDMGGNSITIYGIDDTYTHSYTAQGEKRTTELWGYHNFCVRNGSLTINNCCTNTRAHFNPWSGGSIIVSDTCKSRMGFGGAEQRWQIHEGGFGRLAGDVEYNTMFFEVQTGGSGEIECTRFVPMSQFRYKSHISNKGTLSFPSGLVISGVSTNGTMTISQDDGTLTIGGNLSKSVAKYDSKIYLNGGCVDFVANSTLSGYSVAIISNAAPVTVNVASGKTADYRLFDLLSGAQLTKTGAGVFIVGTGSPATVNVTDGTLGVAGALDFGSGLTLASGTTLRIYGSGCSATAITGLSDATIEISSALSDGAKVFSSSNATLLTAVLAKLRSASGKSSDFVCMDDSIFYARGNGSVMMKVEDSTVYATSEYKTAATRITLALSSPVDESFKVRLKPMFTKDDIPLIENEWGEYVRFSTTQETVDSLPDATFASTEVTLGGGINEATIYVFALRGDENTSGGASEMKFVAEPVGSCPSEIESLGSGSCQIVAQTPEITLPAEDDNWEATQFDKTPVTIKVKGSYADMQSNEGYKIYVKYDPYDTEHAEGTPSGFVLLDGTYKPGDGGTLERVGTGALPIFSWDTTGDYETQIYVVAPVSKKKSCGDDASYRTVKVSVTPMKSMKVYTTDERTKFNEGESTQMKIELSEATKVDLYAFLKIKNDHVGADLFAADMPYVIGMTNENGRCLGVKIAAGTGGSVSPVLLPKLKFLDGYGPATGEYLGVDFTVVLATVQDYAVATNQQKIARGYESNALSLTVNNVEPTISSMKLEDVDSGNESGCEFAVKIAKGQEEKLQAIVKDPSAYDLDHNFQCQWVISTSITRTGTYVQRKKIRQDGNPANAFSTYDFPYLGWTKIELKVKDKDMDDWPDDSFVAYVQVLENLNPYVASPVIEAISESFETVSQTISITCETEGSTIYYTIDGSVPSTENGRLYKGPFAIYQTTTVKALAVKEGWNAVSSIATFTKENKLSEALNCLKILPDNDEAVPWTADTSVSHDGVSSVKSGKIGANGMTSMQLSVKKAGRLSFWWRAKCEEPDPEDGPEGYYDYAALMIDGKDVAYLAGEDTGWQQFVTNITSGGKHVVRWEYRKDSATTTPPDCVWVDQVQWLSATATDETDHTLTTETPVPYTWLDKYGLGRMTDFESAAKVQSGKRDVAGRQLTVEDDYITGTDPTNVNSRFEAVVEMKDGAPRVKWKPDLNEDGTKSLRSYKVWGKEELDDDWEYPTNSLHHFFKVTVEMP